MAASFSYSNRIVHFRYLFQKTTTNPVFGHGMIKLLEPLYLTRTGVRALHNYSRREIGFHRTERMRRDCCFRTPDGEKYEDDDEIRDLLNSDPSTSEVAAKLSKVLKLREEDGRLVPSCKRILGETEISNMWKIACYNRIDSAAEMLRDKRPPHVKWSGKSGKINKEFPLKGEWEMEIDPTDDEHKYTVHFKGKSGWFPRWFSSEKRWVSRWFSSEKKSGSIFVAKNPNVVPNPFELVLEFGEKGPWPSTDPFVIHVRPAGPNVLVGQAWKKDEKCKDPWGELVLVKIK